MTVEAVARPSLSADHYGPLGADLSPGDHFAA